MTDFKVREVLLSKVPTPQQRQGKYAAFIRDVTLRLERTATNCALEYEFPNRDTAAKHRMAIGKATGKKHIATRLIANGDGHVHLYIWRGPNYQK